MPFNIGFTQPIMREDRNQEKLSAVEAFDDYFFLSGRKYKAMTPKTATGSSEQFDVVGEDVKANIPLNILKVVSYMTVIVPLIMLVGKAIARSKYQFTDQNAAASCIQSKVRAYNLAKQAREDYKELLKNKANLIKAYKELSETETSHFDAMVKHLELMQDPGFFKTLKVQSAENKQFLEELNKKYLLLIGKGEKIKRQLKGIVEPKNLRSESKYPIDAAIKDVDDRPRDPILGQDPMSRPQILPASADRPQAAAEAAQTAPKSVEAMRKEVEAICGLAASKEFEEYLDAMIDLSKYTDKLTGMIDQPKMTELLKSKGLKMNFAACVILVQRIARYPLLFKEMKGLAANMGFAKETALLEQAHSRVANKGKETDMAMEILDLKKMIEAYKAAYEKNFGFLNINKQTVLDERAKAIASIKYYLGQKKALIEKIDQVSPPETGKEAELYKLRKELLTLQIE